MNNDEKILEIKNLKVYFDTEEGTVKALENVNLFLKRSEILGVIGETGSGKSVTAYTITRLLPQPPGRILNGKVLFNGEDLLQKSEDEMLNIRGRQISMIFQEPMTALNPVFTVQEQMTDVISHHEKISKKQAIPKAIRALELVKIPDPELVMKKYPHELSGGMRQRVMIALALSCEPELLIADEPTTALDVTVQAQILALILEMRERLGLSVILITHNFGIVAEICDSVAVMYAGNIVEFSSIFNVFENPLHPYTDGLLKAIPPLDEDVENLNVIPGVVPNLISPPSGCRFHPRCYRKLDVCEKEIPELIELSPGHFVACHNPLGGGSK
ncbi:MAG: peptide/nickel transport system ATP-binding protein [Thermotogaceae bacterium]|nr:peptide/nickel transport system ATP-binding protein [Thermotogaceae bacterium]